jgi:protein-L-isoaspartate(D-aspartate) O-methyltransferase
LLDQLTDDGRLLIPVGSLGGQMLERWQRSGMEFTCEEILPVAFVPLRGEHGWEEDRHSLFF